MTPDSCDIAIVGAGPSGLYGAYYAGFRGMSTIVIDALPEVGGQISAMYPEKDIYDVAGFPAIKGRELVTDLFEQAKSGNPTFILGEQVTGLEHEAERVLLTTATGREIAAKAVIIAGGIGAFRPRPVPVGEEWVGRGVSYFVTKIDDYRDRDVVIIGGGDSAVDWAWTFRDLARSVTLVHRRNEFRAHAGTVDKVRKAGVRLMTPYELSAIHGDGTIEEVEIVSKDTTESMRIPATDVIAALGFLANLGPIAEWGLELDKRHLIVDSAMRTNLPRVFAAGDLVTYEGKVPLISVGFGEVATAVNNAAPLVAPSYGVFPGHSSDAK